MTVLSRSKKAASMEPSLRSARARAEPASGADQQPADGVLGIADDQGQDLVAGAQDGVAPGHDQAVVTDHGHDGGVAGDLEVGQGDPLGRRALGQGHLHQVGRSRPRTAAGGPATPPRRPPRPGR